ncbi:MAG: DEAD/DEAH box helicase [Eggerthellaceae bacterium]
MLYTVKNNELLRIGDDGFAERISAMEIWGMEQAGDASAPHLSDVGLRFNEAYAKLNVVLEASEDGSCGIVNVYASNTSGEKVALSPEHSSDHVVMGKSLMPLHQDELSSILSSIENAGVTLGCDLSIAQYLRCAKAFEDKYWYSQTWAFDAAQWAIEARKHATSQEPISFTAKLSDYQVQGSDWLTMMISNGVGGILGDGMGLGKTVQMIKAICDLLERKPDARVLIVCPSALIENWRREIDRFTCGLQVSCHIGNDRTRNYREISSPIVITTYDTARIDGPVLMQIQWDILILDEAQYIKNPSSQRAKAIKKLPRNAGIAITGTPFENHLTDVWSIMDFCFPGFLGSIGEFTSRFQDEEYSAAELGQIVAPFLLRRRQADVQMELPEIIKIPVAIKLRDEEAQEYEERKLAYKKSGSTLGAINNLIQDLSAPEGTERHLTRLKYEYLDTVAQEIIANGEKMIVFTNTIDSINYLQNKYSKQVPTFALYGDVPTQDRVPLVDKFSDVDGAALLICNPTVGGAGLNIVAANHVFHLSPQWNPAVIDQADARAHRRGQSKTVTAHYPFFSSTIEEYMWNKVLEKRDLSALVSVGNKGAETSDELNRMLNLDPTKR